MRSKAANLNRKKHNLAVAVKNVKKLFKRKKPDVDYDGDVIMEAAQKVSSKKPKYRKPKTLRRRKTPAKETGTDEPAEKKMPIIKEDKLRRTDLPLKLGGRKSNKHSNVIDRQPVSKKKARKMAKIVRRVQKEKELQESAMQD